MLQDRAQANVRKLRAWTIITSVAPLLVLAAFIIMLYTDVLTVVQTFLLFIAVCLLDWLAARFITAFVWKKYVFDMLYKELDAPLYVEILSYMGKYDPFALHQLQRLYAEGRHADVVSLCTTQLGNPYAKRYALTYLSYMESAYFHLGDDAKLREIHEATEWQLTRSKNPAKTRSRFPIHDFYTAYLKHDTDACEAYLSTVPSFSRLSAVNRHLLQARMEQLRGNTDRAAEHFRQVLIEAPNTPMAVTAKAHLEALERGEGYETAFPEARPDPLFPVITSEKRHKAARTVMWVCIIVSAALLAYSLILDIKKQRDDYAWREEVRVAMEVDYDGVQVLDWFTISDGENWLDTLAVCSTDKDLVVVALYCLEDNPDELRFDTLVAFTEDELTGSILPSHAFYGCTAEYLGICAFYKTEEEIPADATAYCLVTVYGRELWVAVTCVE